MFATLSRQAIRRAIPRFQSSWSRPSTLALSTSVVLASLLYLANESKIHLDQSSSPSHLASSDSQVIIDPATKQTFPLYLPCSSSETNPLKLIGLGVRTVSFLRVQVYVAAFYVDSFRLPSLSGNLEDTIRTLLDSGATCVIRIDFSHLRDGFIRALQGRLKKALKANTIKVGSEMEQSFYQGIQEIKDAFPRGSVPKGEPLDIIVSQPGISFVYAGKTFGQVKSGSQDFTIARELVLAYFAEKGEISPALKKSVEEALTPSV